MEITCFKGGMGIKNLLQLLLLISLWSLIACGIIDELWIKINIMHVVESKK
jgi:hypothetical protein